MVLPDVNVLVHAHREDSSDHDRCRTWLEGVASSDEPFALADVVLSGFLRVVTHPRVFSPPSTLEQALAFVEELRSQPNCIVIAPGPRHWEIFVRLSRSAKAKGSLIPDAWLAALAVESGCEWISTDRDFARFPGLKWRHP